MSRSVQDKAPWCFCGRIWFVLCLILSLLKWIWRLFFCKSPIVHPESVTLERSTIPDEESPPDWANLTDVCLLAIYNHLPPHDLLLVAGVCRHWKEVQKRACQGRQELTLLIGGDALDNLRESESRVHGHGSEIFLQKVHRTRFDLPGCSQLTVNVLLSTFPNVSHLCLSASDLKPVSKQLPNLASLLDGWSGTLVSLKLGIYFPRLSYGTRAIEVKSFSVLKKTINSLKRLRYLTIFSSPNRPLGHKWTITLVRLHEFTIDTADCSSFLGQSLEKFAFHGKHLKSIRLGTKMSSIEEFEQLLQLGDTFLGKIEHLRASVPLDHTLSHYPLIFRLFPLLTSITSLHLDVCLMSGYNYRDLIFSLASLQQLSDLKLDYAWDSQNLVATERPPNMPRLWSVKQLTLRLSLFNHTHRPILRFHVKSTFPSLHRFNLHYHMFKCNTCHYGKQTDEMMADYRLMAIPFAVAKFCAAKLYAQAKSLKISGMVVTFDWDHYFTGKVWTPEELSL